MAAECLRSQIYVCHDCREQDYRPEMTITVISTQCLMSMWYDSRSTEKCIWKKRMNSKLEAWKLLNELMRYEANIWFFLLKIWKHQFYAFLFPEAFPLLNKLDHQFCFRFFYLVCSIQIMNSINVRMEIWYMNFLFSFIIHAILNASKRNIWKYITMQLWIIMHLR